jgi:murein DD-endopeptidase MepM/ murein hydrolase activator NlpD
MPFPVALRASLRPSTVLMTLLALSVAGCSSDTTRFESPFSNPFASKSGDVTGSVNSAPQTSRVESAPLPAPGQAAAALPPPTRPATTYSGVSGGGKGMASYQPANGDVTGSVTKPQQSASGTHVVGPGETLIGISKRYNVALKDLAKANQIEPYTQLKMGDHLVIPGRAAAAAPAKPAMPTTVAAAKPAAAPAQPKAAPAAPTTKVASAEPQHTARAVTPTPDVSAETKSASGAPSFRWPVRGRIIAGYGPKPNGQQNDGINLSVPEGTPVKAAEDGVVAYAGNELKGYGNLVLIRHPNGFVTAYAHASELMVKRGDNVKRGQTIAKAGQTGTVTAPQVHFEIRKGSTPVDPTQYLNGA